ncbi:Bug family tripartite tricarboxylate transporter substrate binding protein [Marinobacterium aestuarii]|nr:tripartite tricarboxylate transporter substrate binding protein [Marinobacterium aestuarii]
MNFTKTLLLYSAILGAQLGLAPLASADEFPAKPISVVVAWPAGGVHDTAARIVAEHLAKRLPTPVIVTNVTGAGGSTGVRHVEQADPDGYTLGLMGMHALSQNYMNPNATALSDLDPLAYLGPEPGSIQVSADSGIESLPQLIDTLKQEPGSIINGNDSPGGFSYVMAAMMESALDVKLTKVPYQGFAPTVAAILSGEVMSSTLPVPQLAEQHKSGQVKILGVAAEQRHFFAPDVPTFKEQGFDFIAGDYYIFYLPKKVPEERRSRLESALYETLLDPAFQQAAHKAGLILDPRNSVDTQAFLAQQDEKVYPILLSAGLVKARQK